VISHNGGFGVVLGAGPGQNIILGGSIFGNGKGGISAGQPATPTVTQVFSGRVEGEVPVEVPRGSLVQVYADRGQQGQQYLGATRTRGSFWMLQVPVPEGLNVTATLTDPDGNTSAFGQQGAPTVRPALAGEQLLVFTSTRDGNPEIYAHAPGDLTDTRLTEDPAADHSPALSPDSRVIVFVSERSGNPEIWGMDSLSLFVAPLTDHAAPDYDPTFSPDGTQVSFVSERDGNPEVYVMDGDGTDVQRLTDSPGVDRHPSWSPDGQKIAFTSDRSGNAEIWVMNADGSNPSRITDHESRDVDPAWSPDSAQIAFVSERDGNPEIYLMGADGSNPTPFATGVEPAWSPGGDWLAFTSAQLGDAEIFARQVAGQREERLTVSLGMNGQPAWGAGAGGRSRLAAALR
jgi:TolB protein